MAESKRPCLTLIDASGFIFRAYHAVPAGMTTSKGVPTNAVLGFTRMLIKSLRDLQPTHVALAFDKQSRTGRQEIDPNYKANREGPPDDLVPQFALIRKVVEVMNLPILEFQGWEADDVIGTLAARAEEQGFDVLVITGDKDFIQIVDEHIRLYDPMQDKHTTPKDVKERLGIEPRQMRDYLALIGDAIDNVPKVPGIGPKTARELIEQFDTVEALLSRLPEVKKPKIREALEQHQATLRLAKQLVTFKTDLDIETDFQRFVRKPIHDAEARALFGELEFFRLLEEMRTAAAVVTPVVQAPEVLPRVTVETELVTSPEGLARWAHAIRTAGQVAIFPAYEGLPFAATLIGLSLAVEPGQAVYIPLRHEGLGVTNAQVGDLIAALGPVFADAGIRKEGHDLKALVLVLANVPLELEGLHTDVELLSFLLNASRREHTLEDLARERLHHELPPPYDAAAARKAGTGLRERTPEEVSGAYGARAEAVRRLAGALWEEVDREKIGKLAREIEMPLVAVLARMERDGIGVDLAALQTISRHVDERCTSLLTEIHGHAGKTFNVNSNAQLAQVLYVDMQLPVLKKGKTGPSTDAEVLEKLAEHHPLPKVLLEYRMMSKLKSTYLDALGPMLQNDGRLHTTFNQLGAATGRLSSSDPNLQNIPIRTDIGKEIRGAFVAPEGSQIISADYSQIELRLLAHVAEDAVLIEAFKNDEDIHTRTAAEVFGIPAAEVTREQRGVAKMVNFGIAYGLSPHGLSTRLGIPMEEAKSVIDRYFARYQGIARYLDETVKQAHRTGSVETMFGRRRLMTDLTSRIRSVAQAAERAAINMPIQGAAADLVKMAMLRVDVALRAQRLKTRMILQVHDELLFEAPEAEVEAVTVLVREAMAQVATLKVPLKVDVGVGKSWAAAH